jgi:methyltransferase (TIGR00027 family)
MRAGKSSRTAEVVCAGRAIANERTRIARFSDPTARVLASAETREEIDAFFDPRPSGRARVRQAYYEKLATAMVARTVAIDDAIVEKHAPQVVVLGAGLDGRAWRMPELADAIVFEVDHPDSQREKRARIGSLAQKAREVRFVPVDFTRDDLDSALEAARHDRTRLTTWIWEGVVMYLTPREVEETLAILARRSAPASRLAVLYHQPRALLWLLDLFVRWIGEPFRSSYRPEAMRALLARHGFGVVRDEDLREVGRRLGELEDRVRGIDHLRLVIADRVETSRPGS